jgi:hypothetical protein
VALTITFNEPLDPASARNSGLYHIATGVKKHRKMVYSRAVPIGSVIYNDSARSVTVNMAKPSQGKGSVQLTVAAGMLGANGAVSPSAFTTIVR